MKRSLAFALCCSAALVPGPAVVASANDDRVCSYAGVAGAWGYTKTGTIIPPTGPVLFATSGRFTLHATGDLEGTVVASFGGAVSNGELHGSFTVNPDCTGAMTVGVYDLSGNLLRTINMALVFDDRATELRGITTSLVLPGDINLPSVITGQARKQFPKLDDHD